jgi:Flp pilus assembly pilin Flp
VDTTLAEERNMKALVNRFVREDAGQDLIEYGLLVGIITTGTVAAITAIGTKVATYYTNLKADIGA